MSLNSTNNAAIALSILLLLPAIGSAQDAGTIQGAVSFNQNDQPVEGAVVLLVGTAYVALTDANGNYELTNVPTGDFDVIAQREHLSAARQSVTITAGETLDLDGAEIRRDAGRAVEQFLALYGQAKP